MHRLPYYNEDSYEDRRLNAEDVQKVCGLLRCDALGHGDCDESLSLCRCDDNWTGATCTIPVHHTTSDLIPSSATRRLSHTRYTSQSVVSPQASSLYYLHVTADDVELFGVSLTRHSSFSSHQTVDNVQSSCTFHPPLLLTIKVDEYPAADGQSKEERNLGLPSDGHLSLSVTWTSRFHNRDPRNATLFLGSFDASNTFFSSGGSTAAQSIAPTLLALHSSPSDLHTVNVWLGRCDHYAIRIQNTQGAVHDIGYHLRMSLTGVVEGEKAGIEEEEGDERESARARRDSAAVGAGDELRKQSGHHPHHQHSESPSSERGGYVSTALHVAPWLLSVGLGALVVALLWRRGQEAAAANSEERRPLL